MLDGRAKYMTTQFQSVFRSSPSRTKYKYDVIRVINSSSHLSGNYFIHHPIDLGIRDIKMLSNENSCVI